MLLNKDLIEKLAHLSRLEVDPKKEDELVSDLNKILDWMEKLKEVDTDNVEPLMHMSEEINVFRKDEPNNTLDHEKCLSNAPKRDSDYFRVPKVIE